MANPIDEAIIEGFICPSCMNSFRTAEVLRVHFETEHKALPRVSSDGLLSQLSNTLAVSKNGQSHAFYDSDVFHFPTIYSRSLTVDFKKLRKCRVNRDALEMNNLLIRLERLVNAPAMNRTERREFEQSVVPWIDVKVDLCPSCGKTFGLGIENAYPIEDESSNETVENTHRLHSVMRISKIKLTRITNAILDYNPIFRRHHHCRLCGHVLCADCSHFLTRTGALALLRTVDEHNLDRPSSPGAANAAGGGPNMSLDPIFRNSSEHTLPLVELERGEVNVSFIRMCGICRNLLERKLELLDNRLRSSPLADLNTELRKLMHNVNQSMPLYASIAESLHSGEQRYALEMAKTTRHELLESLQQIDIIRRKLEDMIHRKPTEGLSQNGCPIQPLNITTARLIKTISTMARQFMQTNLPPLRVLPTLEQYDSLTAKRQDELNVRWAEEDRALAKLERRIASDVKNRSTPPMGRPSAHAKLTQDISTDADRLARLAISIDEVSSKLMQARRAKNQEEAAHFTERLHTLETEFQTLSACVQKKQM